jgi:hypothetical protein
VSVIIPRREWRTFGPSFGAAEEAFAAPAPTGVQEGTDSVERSFLAGHGPAGFELDGLAVLGPTFVLTSVFTADTPGTPGAPGRRMVAEMWLYPDGSRILELSTKCLPAQAFQVAAETRACLSGRGIAIGGPQQTKTRAALAFFGAQLAAETAAATGEEGQPDA